VDCSCLVHFVVGEAVVEVLEGAHHNEEVVVVEGLVEEKVLAVAAVAAVHQVVEDLVRVGRPGISELRTGVVGLQGAWELAAVVADAVEAGNVGTWVAGYFVVRRMDCTRRNTGDWEDHLA
jgi:hypothetical protein